MKTCVKCSKDKVLSEFGRDASRADGRYSYCKECRRRPNRKEIAIEELAAKGLKICSKCIKVKPFCAFDHDSSKRLGVTSRCKKCQKESRQERHSSWHDNKKYMESLYNKGQSRCYKCNLIKDAKRFLKTATRPQGFFNLCLECNNSIRREYNRKRSNAARDYVRWEIFEDDNFTCYLCEDILDPNTPANDNKSLTIDHVFPISLGGLDEKTNVRTACMDCNRRKDDSTLEHYLERQMVLEPT